MPAPASTPELLALIRKSGVVPAECLDPLAAALPPDPTQAAAVLVKRRLLTEFQAKLLLVGRHKGFRIGPYLLTDVLGRGGMGAVYKADHAHLDRQVAVKVLTDHTDPITLDRFHREARSAAALDHPNIVRTHDGGRDGDVHYIVLEYVDGRTLDHIIEADGPLPTADAADAIAQAAAGLQHAHERGFLHRDIKPANLIRATDGTVKILDMGLARSTDKKDSLTANLDRGAVVGTADYMSPEQVMNDPTLDIRSDIYSLGATLFALLSGRPLFGGSTVSKLAQHQLKTPDLTDLKGKVPSGLLAVLKKMLEKRPADRYQTPAEVVAALRPWRGKGGSGSQPTPRHRKTSGRRWPVWVAAGVLLVAGGTAASLLLWDRPAQPVAGHPPAGSAPPTLPPPPQARATALAVNPLFRLDTAALEPFRVTHGRRGAKQPALVTGLPNGIGFQAYKADVTGEFAALSKDGGLVLGLANLSPEMSSQFYFQIEGELGVTLDDDATYRLTVEYATDPDAAASMTMQTMVYKDVFRLPLPDTGGEWKTVTGRFVRPAGSPLRATFDNRSYDADAPPWVYLRRFEIAPAK